MIFNPVRVITGKYKELLVNSHFTLVLCIIFFLSRFSFFFLSFLWKSSTNVKMSFTLKNIMFSTARNNFYRRLLCVLRLLLVFRTMKRMRVKICIWDIGIEVKNVFFYHVCVCVCRYPLYETFFRI